MDFPLIATILAYGEDSGDSTWTGLSGLILALLIAAVCIVWLIKGFRK